MTKNPAVAVMAEVQKAFIGKTEIIQKVMMAILAGGHILLEDIPGVGKTTLALAFSKALALTHKRIQFTPDVLPSDVTGFTLYQEGRMQYQPGVAFCNLLLADEINRATSRTQSALLEAMEEGQVTVDGVTRALPKPFIVIATQNPAGSQGTQLLPDSQMDRFLLRLSIGYPHPQDEITILKSKHGSAGVNQVSQVADAQSLLALQSHITTIYLHDAIYDYIIRLIQATRTHQMIVQGGSPRASLAVTRLAQASAFLAGRDYVLPEDVQYVFPCAVEHRLILSPKAKLLNVTAQTLVKEMLNHIKAPRVGRSASC